MLRASKIQGSEIIQHWTRLNSDSEDFLSVQDVQPYLCEYLHICLVPQEEVCRLPAQQSAYPESKHTRRQLYSIPVQLQRTLLFLLSLS